MVWTDTEQKTIHTWAIEKGHEWTQKAADSKMYSFLDKGEIGWDSEF